MSQQRIIKVCGMREAENIRQADADRHIDWIGLIFWPGSRRYVSSMPAYLPQRARRVGVFVDERPDIIREKAEAYGLDLIQLHGHESPDDVRALHPWPVIKAFSIRTADDLLQTAAYEGVAWYFLFDTKGKAVGGNGEKFDWQVLDSYQGRTPFLLSGGIGPDDARSVRAFRHPRCAGIDLNSRFETEPGLKDITKIKQFLEEIHKI